VAGSGLWGAAGWRGQRERLAIEPEVMLGRGTIADEFEEDFSRGAADFGAAVHG